MPFFALLFLIVLVAPAWAAPDTEITPKPFSPPAVTGWRPSGCRSVPYEDPVLLPRTAFRRAHGDLESTDEVEVAFPPAFAREWVAETGLYQVTTPSFDSVGNLYMTPLLPHEPILLISLDGATGARRFVVPLEEGQRGGGAAPLVLREPETGAEVVYLNSYSRLLAVRTDGTVLWDVPTGLGSAGGPDQSPIGLNWLPNADAIVALTRDGYVLLHDRSSGAPLREPLQLPGERTPPNPSNIPPALAAQVDDLLAPLVRFRSGGTLDLINVLLGGDSEVANNFSIDPRTGRLWIAATAPDEEDGATDGTSELGALYRLDVLPADGGGWRLVEACRRNFEGGSASTPTLGQDGRRVYLGDDSGALLAIDADDCRDAWSVPLDSQIFGSVAASADGREIYASSARGIFQVFDDGDRGRRGWTASLDVYDVPAELANYRGLNLLLVGAGANGLMTQVGVGISTETQSIPVRTGVALVDRATGAPRWFADGLEESLAAMSTGPDGSLFLSHSPLRRAFAFALGLSTEPLIGGVGKWSVRRHDLLARDAACAVEGRAANAIAHAAECPDSAAADARQVDTLREQTLAAVAHALAEGDLDASAASRVARLATEVGSAPASAEPGAVVDYLARAESALGAACDFLVARTENPRRDACTRSRLAASSAAADPPGLAAGRTAIGPCAVPRRLAHHR